MKMKTAYHSFWDKAKAELKGTFIAICAYIKKEKEILNSWPNYSLQTPRKTRRSQI
jgi:hypothetical protein